MLEDLFEKLAKTPNVAGKELLEILRARRQQYEKYPEELVLMKVFKEFLLKHKTRSQNENVSLEEVRGLSLSEFAEISEIIYDNNVHREMMDITRHVGHLQASSARKFRSFYWEKFSYEQNGEITWRIALNVKPEEELLERIDKFAQEHHCFWKYVNTPREYNRRTDPVIIYFPKDEEKNKDALLREVSDFIKPYLRRDKYDIFGYENLNNGIFYAKLPTQKRIKNDLLKCFDDVSGANIGASKTRDELNEAVQQTVQKNTIQDYLVSRILSGEAFSGGALAIHEWMIDLYQEAGEKVCIRCFDGAEVHKNAQFVWKDKGGKRLWHRAYIDGYDKFVERDGKFKLIQRGRVSSQGR